MECHELDLLHEPAPGRDEAVQRQTGEERSDDAFDPSAIGNEGVYQTPRIVDSVVAADGTALYRPQAGALRVVSAKSADQIYHLAAVVGVRRVLSDPIRVLATNIAGTERLLRAVAAGGRQSRVMLASTSEVYGFNKSDSQSEDDELTYKAGNWTRWSYAVTKLAGEHFANAYMRERNLPITIMRFFNMVGPRQRGEYGMVLPNFVRQAVHGLPITAGYMAVTIAYAIVYIAILLVSGSAVFSRREFK